MQQIKGMLFLLGAFTLAGTSVVAARYVTGKLGPYTITCVSLLFAILFLLPLTRWKTVESLFHLTGKDWIYLFFQSVCGVFLYRMFLLFGLLHTSSAEAGILTGATPAITVILSRFLLKEKITSIKLLGIFCTVAGILLIQNIFTSTDHFSMAHLVGNLFVICSATCESLFNTCSKIAVTQKRSGPNTTLSPILQTILVSLIAIVLCLLPASFEQPLALLAQADQTEWFALIWYGVFVTALAYIFWYAGIKHCTLSTAAAFSGMIPFTALVLSVLILKEQTTLQQWSGCILLISSMALIGFTKKSSNIKISSESKNAI